MGMLNIKLFLSIPSVKTTTTFKILRSLTITCLEIIQDKYDFSKLRHSSETNASLIAITYENLISSGCA